MDLISKPRSKSIVWLYFGLKADEKGRPLNTGEAVCRLCRKIVLAKGGNTTNLRSHLKRRHRADFFETTSSATSGALLDTQGDFFFKPKIISSLKTCGILKYALTYFLTCLNPACLQPSKADQTWLLTWLTWGCLKVAF